MGPGAHQHDPQHHAAVHALHPQGDEDPAGHRGRRVLPVPRRRRQAAGRRRARGRAVGRRPRQDRRIVGRRRRDRTGQLQHRAA